MWVGYNTSASWIITVHPHGHFMHAASPIILQKNRIHQKNGRTNYYKLQSIFCCILTSLFIPIQFLTEEDPWNRNPRMNPCLKLKKRPSREIFSAALEECMRRPATLSRKSAARLPMGAPYHPTHRLLAGRLLFIEELGCGIRDGCSIGKRSPAGQHHPAADGPATGDAVEVRRGSSDSDDDDRIAFVWLWSLRDMPSSSVFFPAPKAGSSGSCPLPFMF